MRTGIEIAEALKTLLHLDIASIDWIRRADRIAASPRGTLYCDTGSEPHYIKLLISRSAEGVQQER